MGAPIKLRSGRTISSPKFLRHKDESEDRGILDLTIFGFDFSKWQDFIPFAMVLEYGAKFVILRSSYGIFTDERFHKFMQTVLEFFGQVFSIYHYYDPRYSPQEQANTIMYAANPYKKSIRRVWLDLEFTWGGGYEASTHWQKLGEILINNGYDIGFYTRQTWWDYKVGSNWTWFTKFPMWAAQYSNKLTLVPKGCTVAIWQKGTPAIGDLMGIGSKEVDLNIMDDEFYQSEYGMVIEEPPIDEGDTMTETHIGVVQRDLSSRTGPGTSYPYKTPPGGILKAGDIVIGTLDLTTNWFHYDRILRFSNGAEELWDAWSSAIYWETANPPYMTVAPYVVIPDPEPTLKPYTIVHTVKQEGYKTVSVQIEMIPE